MNSLSLSKCLECGKQFKKLSKLQEHLLIHTGEKPFACSCCSKTFRRKFHLSRHEKIIHSEVKECPFKCSECGMSFSLKHQLNRHLKSHSSLPIKLLECATCNKPFSKVELLRVHCAIEHQGPIAFSCDKCDYSTNIKKDYNRHKKRVHSKKLYCCPLCSENFTTWTALTQHKKEHKNISIENDALGFVNYCIHCDRTFEKLSYFKRHQNMHNGKWTCLQCKKIMSSSSALKVHVKTIHEGLKPYKCTKCEESFAHKHLLSRHLRMTCFIGGNRDE